MKTMAFALVGTVLVALHTESAPSDEEWSSYIELMKSIKDISRVRSMAFTDGGAPNSKQRKDVNDVLNGRPGLAVVVSASTVVRGVVTALNWFNPLVRAFPPERLADAYDYLKVNRDEMQKVNRVLGDLQMSLGVKLKCLAGRPQMR